MKPPANHAKPAAKNQPDPSPITSSAAQAALPTDSVTAMLSPLQQALTINPEISLRLKRIRDIPALPDVVSKIVQLMSVADTPASHLARLISLDPGLTTRVLRMVNSAAYGFEKRISSIQHAIMLLGFNTVRGLVLSASIMKLFEEGVPGKSLDHKAFWEHSLLTAILSQMLVRELNLLTLEDAFSGGLLHDIGKLVFDQYFVMDYLEVLEQARERKMSPHGKRFIGLEEKVIGIHHGQVGQLLAEKWKLPDTLTHCIAYHGHPNELPEEAMENQNLVYVVALANELAKFSHVLPSLLFAQFQKSAFHLDLLTQFKLEEKPEVIETLLTQLADERNQVQDFLN